MKTDSTFLNNSNPNKRQRDVSKKYPMLCLSSYVHVFVMCQSIFLVNRDSPHSDIILMNRSFQWCRSDLFMIYPKIDTLW